MSENEEEIKQNDMLAEAEGNNEYQFDEQGAPESLGASLDDAYDRAEDVFDEDDETATGVEDEVLSRGYDGYENPIGLTQAFAPIVLPEDDSDGASWSLSWSNAARGSSNGWDQIVPDDDTPDDWHEPDDGMFSQEDENVRRRARRRPAHHAVMEYDSIPDEEYERAALETGFNEQAVAALAAEKQAKSEGADAYAAAVAAAAAAAAAAGKGAEEAEREVEEGFAAADIFAPEADGAAEQAAVATASSGGSKAGRGKHSAGKKQISVHERKSRRTRRALIVIIVLLVALLGAIGYFAYHLYVTGQTVAVQQTQTSSTSSEVINNDTNQDATTTTTKKTEVPNLVDLIGLDTEGALKKLGHGATVKSERAVNEEGSVIKKSLTVPLTDEPADTKTGTPTVYLGLDKDGRVVQAGYSTSTSSLGFGAIGFVDAVENENVIENTLRDAGVNVKDGAAVLPSDKMEYSTYDTDGTTLKRERCSFSGNVALNGANYNWSAVLSYDYANANLTGNLADTVRVIYVYVSRE